VHNFLFSREKLIFYIKVIQLILIYDLVGFTDLYDRISIVNKTLQIISSYEEIYLSQSIISASQNPGVLDFYRKMVEARICKTRSYNVF
jgi:hypothetical protein